MSKLDYHKGLHGDAGEAHRWRMLHAAKASEILLYHEPDLVPRDTYATEGQWCHDQIWADGEWGS